MNKTMIALLTATSIFAFSSVQAADLATPAEKPVVESAAPAKAAKPAKTKKVAKQKKGKQSGAKKTEGAVSK